MAWDIIGITTWLNGARVTAYADIDPTTGTLSGIRVTVSPDARGSVIVRRKNTVVLNETIPLSGKASALTEREYVVTPPISAADVTYQVQAS